MDMDTIMEYNFDEVVDRLGSNSVKWDSAPADVLPMWVADMDFKTAPAVIEALRHRVEHGVFGYTRVPDEYYAAIESWFSRRHGWQIERESVIYTSGVVPALSAIIKALTKPGENVLIQTPVYNCFFSSIRNNGCEIADSKLVYDNQTYTIDFEDLEKKASDPLVTVMLLCNPHNPAGRVWTRSELERIADICERNGVTVISDEIHCEITFEGHDYIPFATINNWTQQNSVICCSPTKAFNIAGLQIANIVCPDIERRKLIDKAININEVCDVNCMGVVALIAAYNEGEKWLEALNKYIYGNYIALCEYFERNLPELKVTKLEGTYLVWVDCRAWGIPSAELERKLIYEDRLWLNSGTMYGSDGFMRINIACPRSVMIEGLHRLHHLQLESVS